MFLAWALVSVTTFSTVDTTAVRAATAAVARRVGPPAAAAALLGPGVRVAEHVVHRMLVRGADVLLVAHARGGFPRVVGHPGRLLDVVEHLEFLLDQVPLDPPVAGRVGTVDRIGIAVQVTVSVA